MSESGDNARLQRFVETERAMSTPEGKEWEARIRADERAKVLAEVEARIKELEAERGFNYWQRENEELRAEIARLEGDKDAIERTLSVSRSWVQEYRASLIDLRSRVEALARKCEARTYEYGPVVSADLRSLLDEEPEGGA